MLKHTKGNLIDLAEEGEFDIIVHGCNCQNTMASGIAKEIRERYPQAYVADTTAHNIYQYPVLKLGNFTAAFDDQFTPKFQIVNAYTQLHYWPRGIDHFEYESFQLILAKLLAISPEARYGLPFIGMGLAGGDMYRIFRMIEAFAQAVTEKGGSVTLVEYDGT
jgi:O-acetyl-ADP-ribose deacetylase (regulator of RNase III)